MVAILVNPNTPCGLRAEAAASIREVVHAVVDLCGRSPSQASGSPLSATWECRLTTTVAGACVPSALLSTLSVARDECACAEFPALVLQTAATLNVMFRVAPSPVAVALFNPDDRHHGTVSTVEAVVQAASLAETRLTSRACAPRLRSRCTPITTTTDVESTLEVTGPVWELDTRRACTELLARCALHVVKHAQLDEGTAADDECKTAHGISPGCAALDSRHSWLGALASAIRDGGTSSQALPEGVGWQGWLIAHFIQASGLSLLPRLCVWHDLRRCC